MKSMTIGIGQRPSQHLEVTTADGKQYDLGTQVEGNDPVAKFYQWRQNRKIKAYCRDRLRILTGIQRDDFLHQMENLRG